MSNEDQYQNWFAENYPNGTEPMFSFGRKVWNACCLQGAKNRKNDLVAQNSATDNTANVEIEPCLNFECTYNDVNDSEGGNCVHYHFDNICECNDYRVQ